MSLSDTVAFRYCRSQPLTERHTVSSSEQWFDLIFSYKTVNHKSISGSEILNEKFSFKTTEKTDTRGLFFFKNDFMFPPNIALKKADNSNTMRQAQPIWSENKKGINQWGTTIILWSGRLWLHNFPRHVVDIWPAALLETENLHMMLINIACIVLVLN